MAVSQYHTDLARRKRMQIENAAIRLFLDAGFDATTMNEIAEKADVSIMTLYKHFPSKDLLFAATIDCLIRKIADALNQPVSRCVPPRTALIAYLDAYCRSITQSDIVETLRLLVAMAPSKPQVVHPYKAIVSETYNAALLDYIEWLVEQGVVRSHRVSDSTGQMLAYMEHSFLLPRLLFGSDHNDDESFEELATIAIDTFLAAYSPIKMSI